METAGLLPNAPSSHRGFSGLEESGDDVLGLFLCFRVEFASVCMYSPPRLLLYHLLFSVGRCRLPNPSDGGGRQGRESVGWFCHPPPRTQKHPTTLTGWLTVVGMVLRLPYRETQRS